MVAYVAAVLIGALVGTGELIARYRDAPLSALKAWSAMFYIGVNATASGVALALIHAFGWNFDQSGKAASWTQVLVAGFGAMALFRSSLFLVRVGEQDVGVGPSSFLQTLLSAADRDVDRRRAEERAAFVSDTMKNVAFEKAVVALPTFCLTLMQNVPHDVQEDLSSEIRELADSDMDDGVKVLNLGLRLLNVVGANALQAAVKSLGPRIAVEGTSPAPEPAGAPEPEPSLPPIPPAPAKPAAETGEDAATEPAPEPVGAPETTPPSPLMPPAAAKPPKKGRGKATAKPTRRRSQQADEEP